MVRPLEEVFPGLAKGGFQITSPIDKRYNCIAYAAGDPANWWWPLAADVKEVFWPAGVERAETLGTFRDAFATLFIPSAAVRNWNRASRKSLCSPPIRRFRCMLQGS